MIPLRDENPTARFGWVTLALVAGNVAVFLWMMRVSTSWWAPTGPQVDAIVARLGFVPAAFTADPWSPAVWATVFTSMFVHAGWLHLGGNMLYLWIFGNNVEDRLGPLRFVGFYLLCGVVAVLMQWSFSRTSVVPVIGASGAIAGLLGAYLLLFPRAEILTAIPLVVFFEVASLPAWIVIGVFFVLQVAQAIVTAGQAGAGGVAFFAHIGGFLAGMALAAPLAAGDRWRRRSYGGRHR
jgi:membrane associated rhomboid family serine protease